MKLSLVASGVAVILASASSTSAADAEYKTCIDATGSNTGWAMCGMALIERNEAKMNGYLKKLREVAEGDTLTAIEDEQTAWSSYYDVACEFYNDQTAFGREGQVLSYPSCKADAVAARSEQLRDYVRQIDP